MLIHLNRITSMTLLLFSLSTANALACSCIDATPKEQLASADVVFTGKVTSIIPIKDGTYYGQAKTTLSVLKRYKNENNQEQPSELTITSDVFEASCGIEWELHQTYIVFATKDQNNQLTTNLCDGTREVKPDATWLTSLERDAPVPTAPPKPSKISITHSKSTKAKSISKFFSSIAAKISAKFISTCMITSEQTAPSPIAKKSK